ncbi:hypothetical protein [Thermococcus sp. 21S9]|uniref:hypothetical protein n=1 Tax=Thermococcus sp. 21S9 TaxID=1638223 RepID=UPI00143B4A24|nr:hypothetical protein [Thermococcus sp. 21S9]NJE55371.1 hypothetical protein [Thermococcus sp. 21S9]
MREIAFMIIGILLVSLVPAVGGVSSETVSTSTRANGLLLALDRLANYTHSLNCTSEQADALREKAWELYRAGNYNESAEEALKAMGLYRSALEYCKTTGEENMTQDWVSVAETELGITSNVLEYARKLLESNELSEEDRARVEAEYNQTLLAYNAVKIALENNDTQDLPHKVAFLQTSRERLEEAINLAVQNSVRERAELMGRAQLRRIDRLMAMGVNSTELLTLRAELENAINSGDSEKVLQLLKEITRVLADMGRSGKIGEIVHTTPGHPSFPGSSEEGSPGAPPKKSMPGNNSGERR